MLERVPTIPTPDELLDRAFQRAMKLDVYDPVRYHRIRKTETTRMQSVVDTLSKTLYRLHKSFPSVDQLRPYQQEVIEIITGIAKLRKALSKVQWAGEKIRELGNQATEDMRKVRDVEGVKRVQHACYGRISDIVAGLRKELQVLADTRDKIRVLPTISPDYATVVIAGFPNVGKSTLLANWTKARPEIADYAFTTKHAQVGHFEMRSTQDVPTRYQVVDTPGLLDRKDEDRNDIERQAIAALRHTSDAVLFLIDPHSTKYTIEEQEHLLAQVQSDMHGLPMVIAETKLDLGVSGSERLKFSTQTGEGMDQLRIKVLEALEFEGIDLEEDPLSKWFATEQSDEWGALPEPTQ